MYREKLNTGASDSNTLVHLSTESGCCPGSDNVICQYSATVSSFSNLTGIVVTYGGSDITVNFSGTISDHTLLAAEINTAIKSLGFINDDDPLDVQVTEDSGDVTINVWGEAVVKEYAGAGGPHSASALCNTQVILDYTTTYSGGTNPNLVEDGVSTELTGTFANSAAGATGLQTAIEGATSGEQSVVCTYDGNLDTILVTITHDNGKTFVLDGVTMPGENARTIYEA